MKKRKHGEDSHGGGSPFVLRALALAAIPALLALAGCGGGSAAASSTNGSGSPGSSNGNLSITPGSVTVDTNCTGCNGTNASGSSVEQFSATLSGGGAAAVTWSLSPSTGAGSITASGQYTPPGYLAADSVKITVTATLTSNTSQQAAAAVTVTPGFLQPLTPENVALGANGTLTVTGYIAEAGGGTGINYAVASTPGGSTGGEGALGAPNCVRGSQTFTYCTVTYTAPSTISSTAATYVVATVGTSASKTAAEVLLNTANVDSNPAAHQAQLGTPISLGSSGSNNDDYDTTTSNGQTQVSDCCGGTLGSLIQDTSGKQYLLSNNHVLARSDQASAGEDIVQPGLIDDNCTPFGNGGTESLVGTLTGFVPLQGSHNVDAAIAQVTSGAVSASGNILELGARQANGTLAAAPPGVSSTGGKGEAGSLNMTVAKSGRTTGLTCASISAVSMNVQVSYFTNCAETDAYLTKTYSNQIAISGNQFSDAGDSGSLVVDTGNAEPVGLFFAGGVDTNNVSEGVANPVSEVLSELSSQVGNGTSYTFVGAADHPVSCLNYGDATAKAAQAHTLTGAETARTDQALATARALVNPSTGILGVSSGKSSDRIGEGAVIVYVDQAMSPAVPAMVNGVRTMVVPTTAQALALGAAPRSLLEAGTPPALPAVALSQAVAAKQQIVAGLMKQNPAFFGVGVGQSLDNPKEAALVIYVDRRSVPASLPAAIDGLRVRYVIMDRLHVTRAYASGLESRSRCLVRGEGSAAGAPGPADDPFHLRQPQPLDLH